MQRNGSADRTTGENGPSKVTTALKKYGKVAPTQPYKADGVTGGKKTVNLTKIKVTTIRSEVPLSKDGRPQIQDEIQGRRRGMVFALVVGVVMVILGVALICLWPIYHLRDLLVIGPGSLILGLILVAIGASVVLRNYWQRYQIKRQLKIQQEEKIRRQEITEYYLPPADVTHSVVKQTGAPSANALYGTEETLDSRLRRGSIATVSNKPKPLVHRSTLPVVIPNTLMDIAEKNVDAVDTVPVPVNITEHDV